MLHSLKKTTQVTQKTRNPTAPKALMYIGTTNNPSMFGEDYLAAWWATGLFSYVTG